MNVARILLLMLSLGSAAPVLASQDANERAYLQACAKHPGVPVPVAVVSPEVGPEYHGTAVHLEFLVDASGRPAEFTIKSAPDDVVAKQVVQAVKRWRFQPAEIDGRPIARRVSLPVKIVDPERAAGRYAAAH